MRKGSNKWHRRNKHQSLKRHGKKWCIVYGLIAPDDPAKRVRYVGQTRNTSKRMAFFKKTVKFNLRKGLRNSPVEEWVATLMDRHLLPRLIVLDDNATWDVSEILWIERLRAQDYDLLNILRGGNDSYDALKREGKANRHPDFVPLDDLELEYREIMRGI